MTTPLVVGLGSPDRSDDAVGPEVARTVASEGPAAVRVIEHEDPTALLDLWAGHDLVVVVDAVCSGGPAGSLHQFETGIGAAPMPERAWSATGRGGTHAFGLVAAVELARALHRLPSRLVVIGVEATGFEHGAPMTAPVAAAVPAAAAQVIAVLAESSSQMPR